MATAKIIFLIHEIKNFILEHKQSLTKNIWIVGGSELIKLCLEEQIIDEMILSVVPKMIGKGIPLFLPKVKESNWRLREVKSFKTSLVNLIYEISK